MQRGSVVLLIIVSLLLAVANTPAMARMDRGGSMPCCASRMAMPAGADAHPDQHPCHAAKPSLQPCHCHGATDPAPQPMAAGSTRPGTDAPAYLQFVSAAIPSLIEPPARAFERDSSRLEDPSLHLYIKHQSLLM